MYLVFHKHERGEFRLQELVCKNYLDALKEAQKFMKDDDCDEAFFVPRGLGHWFSKGGEMKVAVTR